MNIFNNYPDLINNLLFPMIVGIFALAFPILLQAIERIDDKYHSTTLITVFKADKRYKCFQFALYMALVLALIWICQFKPSCETDCWVINNSALLLVLVSTVFLTVMIILVVDLIFKFYNNMQLTDYLIKCFNERVDENDRLIYFEAISKMLQYAIKDNEEEVWSIIRTFLNNLYREEQQ